MPNFNSREVAERFREQCVADGLWPMQGDSELEHRLAVFLDSALLAANPGAEELARDLDRVAQFLCIDGENCPACKGIFSRVVNILSAALESARREERVSTLKELCSDCSQVKTGLGLCDACKVQEKLLAIPELDSLAEKEGGR